MNEQIQQKDSKKLTLMYILIVFSLATIAVIAVIYFVEPEEIPEGSFLNPTPVEDKNLEVKQSDTYIDYSETAKRNNMTMQEIYDMKEDIQKTLDSIEELDEPEVILLPDTTIIVLELTDVEKDVFMPQSVVEMIKFLGDYQPITQEQGQILLNYAVDAERGDIDEMTDKKARILMVQLIG